ncbi:hypothetical protein AB0I51_12590 [Streptomyces sp. NPDC050549]|uniref:PepSY domain-containing protein n=1 Tax=Streptomyces sp. NPDC050549 TaxID=3155406 RepID=UPI00343EF059
MVAPSAKGEPDALSAHESIQCGGRRRRRRSPRHIAERPGTRHPEGADDDLSPFRRSAVTGTAIHLVRAAEAGVASLPGTVTAVERDEHRGRTVWKVETVAAGGARHEVTVYTADGTVTCTRPGGSDDGEAATAPTTT